MYVLQDITRCRGSVNVLPALRFAFNARRIRSVRSVIQRSITGSSLIRVLVVNAQQGITMHLPLGIMCASLVIIAVILVSQFRNVAHAILIINAPIASKRNCAFAQMDFMMIPKIRHASHAQWTV